MSEIKGNRVKMLRTKKGLDQEDVAKAISVSRSTIAMIENNKRRGTQKNIKRLAEFFGVSVDYLEGRENQEDYILDFLLNLDITKDGKIQKDAIPDLLNEVEQYIKKKKHISEGN